MTTAALYKTDKKSRLITWTRLFLILAILSSALCSAQQTTKAIDWGAYRFLLGEWVGEGGGDPGQGVGGFTFSLDLQNTILANTKTGNDSMSITFEFAPPGKPEAFTRYINANARRKK